MSPIDAALNRSRTVLGTLAFILIAGALAYIAIPKEADPDINIPIIYVSMHHDGISPEDAERLLVRPMEQELRGIEGVKEMRSTAYEGGANVLMEFEAGFDADSALDDVREKVDLVRPDLPEDTDDPTVNEVNFSLFPVLVVTLAGDVPERTLLRIARDLQDRLEGIGTVLEVNITGDRDEVVEVLVDPVLVESYGLEPEALLTRIGNSNRLVAAGALDTGSGRFSIKVPGLFEDVNDILNLPLVNNGDAVVRIRDIAEVRRGFKDPVNYARLHGKPALALEVVKRSGENIIETIEAVRAIVETERQYWPVGVEVGFSNDKSEDIRTMLTDLQNNVLSAILLVMIVVVAALGLRGGLLVGVAIPGSFLAGVMVLSILGLTVNVVVLFALILAVGMLVDGAIVVTEYADRKLSEGIDKKEAYGLAAKRMAWPIIASTATTLAAFLPLLFWPGVVGEFMKFLPITLIATLSASLAMALIFIPTLGANLSAVTRIIVTAALTVALGGMGFGMAGEFGLGEMAPLIALPAAIGGLVLGLWLGGIAGRLLERHEVDNANARALAAPKSSGQDDDVDSTMDPNAVRGVTGLYVKTLSLALRAPWLVLLLAGGTLVGTIMAYGTIGKGVEFFPEIEPKLMIVNVHARGNLSVDEKDTLTAEVEREILAIGDETGEFKSVYTSSGNFEVRDDEAEDIIGKITLEFVEWDLRRPAAEIKADIRERTAHLAGIVIEIRQEEQGPPTGKPVHLQMSARNPAVLDEAVEIARAHFDTMDGLVDIEDSNPIPGIQWEYSVDRAQASKFGANVAVLGSFIELVTNGLKMSDYRPDDSDEEIDIPARFPEQYRSIDQLDRLRVNTDQGRVPAGNFVTRVAKQNTGILRRVDGSRVAFVKADVAEGLLPNDFVNDLRGWLETRPLPDGVTVEFKGEDQEQQEAQQFLMKAFAIALFLMAIILVTQFNSFFSAFLILFAVIMSTVGVLIGLMVIQEPFGIVMSGIGVIALAGIVVNNNIVLIDTFDRLKKSSATARDAILRTGAQRLRPVMLTTVTTILGLLPMVLQTNIDFVTREVSQGAPSTQWWVQLATAIVFGLAFATLLTLLVTPCWLQLRADISNALARRRAKRASPIAEPSAAE
ncbi:efflux RND transporter permease subunit [Pacificispira sp.]|uniref:efflux RND transporter permease subunit n=1 Tax=Pacificispira sp. TaxID=2888761 RepID=UPI003BA860D6